MAKTLLVTGASGHLGRRVVELLLEAGESNIIAATRTPEKLADFAHHGVEVRQADFEDTASLETAFVGVDRLLLISTDALDKPGRRLAQHKTAVQAAEKAGVGHVLYTSLIDPSPSSPVLIAPDHHGTETALANSSMGWTVLRNNIYADMLLMSLPQAIQLGNIYSAAGEGKVAYVTREDCARAAAAALADDFEGRRTLDVTGPAALSQHDLAALASQIGGKTVGYVPLTVEVLVQNMVGAGLPEPVAQLLASFDAGIAQGQFAGVSSTLEDLTGTPAQSVAEFITASLIQN